MFIAPLILLVALGVWLAMICWAEGRPEYRNRAARNTAGAAQLVVRSEAAEPRSLAGAATAAAAGYHESGQEEPGHDEAPEPVPVG